MVPGGRIELPLSCENEILSLARLPVPPSGPIDEWRFFNMMSAGRQPGAPLFFLLMRMLECPPRDPFLQRVVLTIHDDVR